MKNTLEEYGWIVIILIILSMMIGFASPLANLVSKEIDNTAQAFFPTAEDANKLNTPSISIRDGTLIIIGDSRSEGYKIYADNNLLDTVDVNRVDLTEYPLASGNHPIKVIAIASDYEQSDPSSEVVYSCGAAAQKLSAPTLSINDEELVITRTSSETEKYEIFVDSSSIGTIISQGLVTEYDMSDLSVGTHAIGVVAKATGKEDSNKATIGFEKLEKIAMPMLSIADETLTITVAGATSYDIYIDGSKVASTTEGAYDLSSLAPGAYEIGVIAKAEGKKNSDMTRVSFMKLEKLATPSLSISNKLLTISNVAGATSYEIYIDGSLVDTIIDNAYDLSDLSAGTYAISVIAKADGKKDSEIVTISYTIVEKLATPTLNINDKVLTISGVANAGYYTVYVDGSSVATITETTYDLSELTVGTYIIGVVAKAMGKEDSDMATISFTRENDAPEYVVEIGSEDYVTGKKMVLVYTNEDNVNFDYNGTRMYNASGSQYKYNDTTSYTYVYALVVDKLTDNILSAYEAKVTYALENTAEVINYEPAYDINFSGVVTWDDVAAIYSVIDVSSFVFTNQMKGVIKADLNFDRKVTDEDSTLVENAVYGEKLAAPSLSITGSTLTITGPEGAESYKVFVDGASVGTVTATNSAAEYDLSSLAEGSHTIEVTASATDKRDSDKASVMYEVVASKYKVEVTGHEYATGYKLVLVYTNEDDLYFEYNTGSKTELLADVSVSGYKYQEYDASGNVTSTDSTAYKHIYAGVTPVIDSATFDDYAANVLVTTTDPEVVVSVYDIDINGTGIFDINDVTAAFGIYNGTESVMHNYYQAVFKADVNRDKVVDDVDTALVEDGFNFSKKYPTLSIDGTTLTITGPEGTESYEIFVDGVTTGNITSAGTSTTYDLSDLAAGTYTIGVVAKAGKVVSQKATVSYTAGESDDALTAEEIEASPYLYGIGKTDPTYVVAEFNEDYSEVRIFANGEDSDGKMIDYWYAGNHSGTLASLNVEEGVTSIGAGAFTYCSGISGDLIIPDSVTSIGESAFRECVGFDGELILSDMLTSIGDEAFSGCSGFTGGLVIPDGVTSIGTETFYECSGFNGILTLSDDLTTIGDGAFAGCSGFVGDLLIPNDVTNIGYRAFYKCSGFDGTLSLSDNLTTMGSEVFYSCKNITGDLVIPGGLTSIEYSSFDDCQKIENVIISDGVKNIHERAFAWCFALTSITIPNSVTNIGEYAIESSSSLADIYFNGTESEWNAITFGTDWDLFVYDYNVHFADDTLEKLATPTLKINNNTLSITATGAEYYAIYVDGSATANITTNTYDLSDLAAGTYTIGVVAKATNKTDSDMATISFTVEDATVTAMSGVWRFTGVIPPFALDTTEPVTFTSNGTTYSGMIVGVGRLEYLRGDGSSDVVYTGTKWSSDSYCEVNFGSTPQAVSQEFYDWFTEGAAFVGMEALPKLAMPTVSFNGRYLYLTCPTGAESYDIYVDNRFWETVSATVTSYDVADKYGPIQIGTTIGVIAKADGYEDSDMAIIAYSSGSSGGSGGAP